MIVPKYKRYWTLTDFYIIALLITCLVILIIHGYRIEDLNKEIQILKIHSKLHQKYNRYVIADIEKINSYLRELEDSDSIDKKEFSELWESIAQMNNNFKALGLGYHLDDKDVCPEKEKECEEEKNEDDYE